MNNAVAGPSRPPTPQMPVSDPIPLFFPPPAQKVPPVYFRSTQDLLSTFNLLDAYDKYVKAEDETEPSSPSTAHAADKGKGKEKDGPVSAASPLPQTPAADPDDDDPGGAKGDKKRKHTYKHLIKGAPGKHSMKKDDYLITAISVPPKQRLKIAPFDSRTQREAFSVSLEGLKGWNVNALVLESAQAREDRKKRKELKRLAKAHQSQPQTPLPQAQTPVPTPSSPAIAGTPRPPVARPGSVKPHLPPVQVNGLPTGRVGTNTPRTNTPHPLSAPPVSASSLQLPMRVKKRDRDEAPSTSAPTPAPQTPTLVSPQIPKAIVGAKAGMAGVRPRPLKKQKLDVQGQARDSTVPIQQPTPQGV
ncbi:hypothetical protein BDZ89DRAFT_1059882 [Hymenopellis radicata]|nr:hypothetical protein BDZ89DRAFT_1059882 [Hymenopellis radicata]